MSRVRTMISAYLDNNVLREFLLDRGDHFQQLSHLLELREKNQLRVFGSAKQFEELAGLVVRDTDAYRQMSRRALTLMGPCILRDRSELCHMELRKHKQLSTAEACVPQSLLADFHDLAADIPRLAAMSCTVLDDHRQYRDVFSRLSDEVMSRLSSQGIVRKSLQREAKQQWCVSKT